MATLNSAERTATLQIGDQRYEVQVSDIEFSYDSDRYSRFGCEEVVMYNNPTVEITGRLLSQDTVNVVYFDKPPGPESVITVEYDKEKLMAYEDEKACAEEYYGNDNGNRLARKYRELELDEDEKLLRKHGLVELDGTLTTKGKNFLTNVLFDQFRDEVVEALEAIDDAEREERE